MNREFYVGDDGVHPFIGDQQFLFRRGEVAKGEVDILSQ
jgi:hypothetical protein